MKSSVTVIIPAVNEEANIASALKGAEKAAAACTREYELLVIDDGSTDKTGTIVDVIAKKNSRVRVIHHDKNMGFGFTIREGIQNARKEFVTFFHGDDDTSYDSLRELISLAGVADIVMAYTAADRRPWVRRVLSRLYVLILNLLFGMQLRYVNGIFICKRILLQSVPLVSGGLTIYSEAKVRLIRKGLRYREIPFVHTTRKHGISTAVSMKSVGETLRTLVLLLFDIYIFRQ